MIDAFHREKMMSGKRPVFFEEHLLKHVFYGNKLKQEVCDF